MSVSRSKNLSPLANAENLATTLPPLLVAAERVAATISQGIHGQGRTGQGENFWQFRRYAAGDPANRIDWRQSARTQYHYVRENECEAAQSVWLWADSSASMSYCSSADLPTKRYRAQLLLLALASLLSRTGERFALLDGDIPPSTGRRALFNIAYMMNAVASADSLPPDREVPAKAQVVLFGDFLEPVSRISEAVMNLAEQGHSGHIVQLLDSAELELPFDGRICFEGFEREGDILINSVQAIRSNYLDTIEDHCAALMEVSRAAGWNFITHRTDRSPENCLLALYLALTPENGL